MLEIIRDIIRYFAKWFHHTHCKSNCGADAESSSSSVSSLQANVSHEETQHHHHGGAAISHITSTRS